MKIETKLDTTEAGPIAAFAGYGTVTGPHHSMAYKNESYK